MINRNGAVQPCFEVLGKDTLFIKEDLKKKAEAAKTLFDEEKGVYISGKDRQISYASQVWLVLGGVTDASVLTAVENCSEAE